MRRRPDRGNLRHLAGAMIPDDVSVIDLPDEIVCQEGPGFLVLNFERGSCRHGPVLPRAIVVENEGGYSGTGVCLDCLLENFR